MNDLYTPGKIRLFTGRLVDPFNLSLSDVCIEDIAHALAHIPRFGGHARVFLSVAQHSLWVAKRLPNHLKLAGLLHDASEAYLLDIPSPIKKQLPGYEEAETAAMHTIGQAIGGMGTEWWQLPDVKAADKEALEHEWTNYVHGWRLPMAPHAAKVDFLNMFNELRPF